MHHSQMCVFFFFFFYEWNPQLKYISYCAFYNYWTVKTDKTVFFYWVKTHIHKLHYHCYSLHYWNCYFRLLRGCICVCVCVCVCVCAQSHPTLCNPIYCGLPGSSVHGISQARILEWLPFPSPGHLPNSGKIKPTSLVSSCIHKWILYH